VDGNRFKTILIAGYYGFGNVGDEAILSAMLGDLRERAGDANFIIISGNPAETAAKFGVSAVHWQDINALLQAGKSSDLIILGGGGLFQDHWGVPMGTMLTPYHGGISFYSAFGLLALLYQKPFMIYSVGVGPVTSEEGKELTRWTFDLADLCCVRDQESKDLLVSMGIPAEKVVVTADPAVNLSFSSPAANDILRAHRLQAATPLLGVCVRNWGDDESARRWKQELAATLDRFLENQNAHIVFIPFQVLPRALENDHAAAQEVFSMMKRQAQVTLLPDTAAPETIKALLSHCQLVVGMRLHSLIFAAGTSVPAVALVYDPKVRNFMSMIGLSEFALELDSFTQEQLYRVLETAWLQQSRTRETLETHMRELRASAKKATEMALHLLAGGPKAPYLQAVQDLATRQVRLLSSKEEERQSLLAKVRDQEHEIQVLRAQLGAIEQSRSWKLAQILSRIRLALLPVGSRRASFVRILYRYASGLFAGITRGADASRQWLRKYSRESRAEFHQFSSELQRILSETGDAPGVVIFPPTIGWNISLIQRPHQLAKVFAEKGFLVFFCTDYSEDHVNTGFRRVSDRLWLANGPWKAFARMKNPVVFTLPYNREFLSHFRRPRIVYEVIDDLEVFPGDQAVLQKNHDALLQEAELVLVTADRLMEQVRPVRPDAILCPNAAEIDHFAKARDTNSSSPPPDLAAILSPDRPIIGYTGALARWFDYALLRHAAEKRPSWDFVLIGPNHDNTLLESGILSIPNIHWIGPRDYSMLPEYLRHFNVATIPFLVNNITLATSPIKLFEYMAAGKPIVTTALPECRKYPGVFIAHSGEEFIEHLEYALTLVNDPAYLQKLAQTAQANNWQARAQQIIDALKIDNA
jgi:teichuronic acid biosynthesis glycosyltransferase TuaH